MRQATLLDLPPITRRKLAHVTDCGDNVIEYTCFHCGWCSGWVERTRTISEDRKGVPCPKCNAS